MALGKDGFEKPYNVWPRLPNWLGVAVHKYPPDLMHYQEIIWETKPSLIIETGTFIGGSAWYFAILLDLLDDGGHVFTIDNNEWHLENWPARPEHERITYHPADSVDPGPEVLEWAKANRRVMVSLDSDHSYEHVKKELALYAPMVTKGCYLVVEDTESAEGPGQAVEEFLAEPGCPFEVTPPPPMTTNTWLCKTP